MTKNISDELDHLVDSLCGLVCSVEETRKKLNHAKARLESARQRNEKISSLLERWTADIGLSEKIVQFVQSDIDRLNHTDAA